VAPVAVDESYAYGANIDQAGVVNITKEGLGSQAFNRPAGYTTAPGDLAVNAGTFELNINDSLGDVTVAGDATLIIGQSMTTSPASFIAAVDSSTVYNWEINDWAGTAGVGWSSLDIAGDFIAPAGSRLAITINESALANFTETSQIFPIATIGANLDIAASDLSLDASGFTSGTGTWEPQIVGNTLVLAYTAGAGASAYDTFAAGFPGLTGGFSDDDDNDGFTNGEEWYFGGSDPTSASSTVSGLSGVSATQQGSFTFTHLRPVDSSGVTAGYEWSRTLLDPFLGNGDSDGTHTVTLTAASPTPDIAGYESVTVTVVATPANAVKIFARLRLTLD